MSFDTQRKEENLSRKRNVKQKERKGGGTFDRRNEVLKFLGFVQGHTASFIVGWYLVTRHEQAQRIGLFVQHAMYLLPLTLFSRPRGKVSSNLDSSSGIYYMDLMHKSINAMEGSAVIGQFRHGYCCRNANARRGCRVRFIHLRIEE
jgi:hypothetical protein